MSKLVADMHDGIHNNVPVGKPNFTHDGKHLRADERPLSYGQNITNLHVDQFDAFGSKKQDLVVKRNDITNDLEYKEHDPINDGLIAEAAYDKNEGILTFVRQNGEIFTVAGFLTQSDFGIGPTGPRGPKGKNGFDGYDGDDGWDGSTGCAGPEGKEGPEGVMGDSGADGAQGPVGPAGGPGPQGYKGPDGPMGRKGDQGCAGEQGCPGTEYGPPGASGSGGGASNASVTFSSSDPGGDVLIWGVY